MKTSFSFHTFSASSVKESKTKLGNIGTLEGRK